VLVQQEMQVPSTMRKYLLAVGAAALLSSQASQAAPAQSAPTVDPLVALSLLGSSQSRAAVCGMSATCGLPMTAGASAASASPAVATAASAAAVQGESRQRRSGLVMALGIGGAMVLIAVLATALSGDGDGEPVSPA
jgi:hypothetical protein